MRFLDAAGQFELCLWPNGQYVITEQMEDPEFLPFGTTFHEAQAMLNRRAIMRVFCAEVIEEMPASQKYALEHSRNMGADRGAFTFMQ